MAARSASKAKAATARAAQREWSQAQRRGVEQARRILEMRRRAGKRRGVALAGPAGLLLAEGDSWFDFPFFDVLAQLEDDFGYEVESVAHRGDTLEEMIYDPSQLAKLTRALERLAARGSTPKAILLSGGGNDIAGEEFAVLLNHKASSLPALNEQIVAGVLDERLRVAAIALASAVTHLCRQLLGAAVPILLHGYDYPVPDGRGYLGGAFLLPGPWLEPGFRKKGYTVMRERCQVMVELIDRFNAQLAAVAGGPGLEHVRHVDLRDTLSQETAGNAYRQWWSDELHPTRKGFQAVASRFHRVLQAL